MRAKELTSTVAEFLVCELRPVLIVQDSFYSWKLLSRDTWFPVEEPLITMKYFSDKACVIPELKDVDFMGTTTNMGTPRANDGYLSITAHYSSLQFVTFHKNLQCYPFPGSHNAVNIARLQKVTWRINPALQIPAFTCDNVKNVMNPVNENLMFVAIPCAGHTLNLAVRHALAVPELRTALKRGIKIVKHFNCSRLYNEELKVMQKQLDLPSH